MEAELASIIALAVREVIDRDWDGLSMVIAGACVSYGVNFDSGAR